MTLTDTFVASLAPEQQYLYVLAKRVESIETSLADLTAEVSRGGILEERIDALERRLRIIDGALEETITRIEAKKPGKPRSEHCLWCGKRLDPKARNQRLFCSPLHSHHWREAHPGVEPVAGLSEDNGHKDFAATIVAGEGVVKGSVSA